MIKSFAQFVNESDALAEDAKVSAIVQDIDRNYGNYPSAAAQQTIDMNFLEEKREIPNFAEEAELAKDKVAHCKLYLKFSTSADEYQTQFDFDVTYKGVENFDKPDFNPRSPEQTERLGVSLEGLKLKKIQVKSATLTYAKENFNKDLGKTVLRFLLNVLKPSFDKIGDEALIIRQL